MEQGTPRIEADPERLITFSDDAAALLQEIRRGILVHIQDGGNAAQLAGPLQKAIALRSASAGLGIEEIEERSARLEEHLRKALESKTRLVNGESLAVLDLLAETEEFILQLRIGLENFSFDVSEFVEDSFDFLQIEPVPPAFLSGPDSSGHEAPAEDTFEIDSELLEIFAMESEDLLRNIQVNLEVLVDHAENREALWEIRRNAHTLKGAAGIVGLSQLSAIAHRIEDLLDRLSENDTPANERILAILQSATDHLNAITSGDVSPQLAQRVSQLFDEFETVLAPSRKVSAPVAEIAATEPVAVDEIVNAISLPEAQESAAHAKASEDRSIVRVSLAKLDDLANVVRDLIVSRSVFEQRLIELDRQIEDLHNCTRRLRNASGKLETDFEASMTRQESLPLHERESSMPAYSRLARFGGDRFDSLELDQYTEFYQSTRELSETTNDTFAINTSLDALRGNLENLFDLQRRLIEETHEKLMRIRMVRFGTLATRIQRSIRVTCGEEKKKAEVIIENGELEIDSQVMESLIEPLMHLLKNAVVHGIESGDTRRMLGKPESGRITIRLANEETHIVLQVSDDGGGIDLSTLREKAISAGFVSPEIAVSMSDDDVQQLIFLPGLTTAEKLTLSAGRGVGMSIIRECVESRRGIVSIESVPQNGTTFTIRVPLNLAVTTIILVRASDQILAVPVKLIAHVGEFASSEIKQTGREQTLEFASRKFHVKHLAEYLGERAGRENNGDFINVLIVESTGTNCALVVDEVIKIEEIIIKPLGNPLDQLKGVLGAATLGNGEAVAILDVPALIKTKPKRSESMQETQHRAETISVMIVDDSPSVRHMTSKVVENAGFTAITAKDGVDAMEILRSGRELPRVILTDIEMPRMDGYELAETIKNTDGLDRIPIVFITSRSGEKHREKASELGASEYLTKPFDDSELIGTIKRLADRTTV